MANTPIVEEQTISAEDRAFILSKLSDKWWRLNNLYKIENEDGDLVTFKLRPAQALLFRLMGNRNIILKARQLGFSTAIDIYLLDEALFNNRLKCGIVAQDKGAAGEIFRTKIEVPYDNLPAWLKAAIPTSERQSGANGGRMVFKNGSSIQVATSFRSGTVQRLHISEHGKICAKYPQKAKEVKTGTLNAIHKNAICFIESTAEGVGGDFYTMCSRAMEQAKSGVELSPVDYHFHFFAWWQDPKYRSTVPMNGLVVPKAMAEYFTGVERSMECKLDDEQKQWYIEKEATLGEDMKQEFPSTPLEAFLTSGRKVFNPAHIMTAEGDVLSPFLVYDLEPITGSMTRVNSIDAPDPLRLQRNAMNLLLMWEMYDEDEEYAIGVDIAEGLEHGDRSSIDVVKKSDGEQVAHWFGHIDAELLAYITKHIAEMYGNAYVMPERNNHGHAFIQKLREIYPTNFIYAEQYLDRDNDNETVKLGWLTTKQSKPILSEGMKMLFKGGVSGIRWIGTISEYHSYVYDKKGAMNAQEGCFDDQVMSHMLAQEARARMPSRVKSEDLKRNSSNNHWQTK
ncbi:terminase [Vibrio sp. ABG19]|uniref:terminase n=1 Tax=Vibrio sp. ABG19 TaxID=2817385 RepID=UPI00249F3502|nr:terminase [Vibrio sp. ABG19]WGY45239.1 terminase [Vibrio sp. ABG19]